MRKDVIAIGFAVVAMTAGAILKLNRYEGRFLPNDGKDMAQVSAILAAQGWSAGKNVGGQLPFSLAAYSKPGCPGELLVAPLGFSREMVDDARLAMGPETLFLESGSTLGLLAISQPKVHPLTSCSLPGAREWESSKVDTAQR